MIKDEAMTKRYLKKLITGYLGVFLSIQFSMTVILAIQKVLTSNILLLNGVFIVVHIFIVALLIESYLQSNDAHQIKRKEKQRQRQLIQEEAALQKGQKEAEAESKELKKVIKLLNDDNLIQNISDYQNKLLIAVKYNQNYVGKLKELNKLLQNGLKIIKSCENTIGKESSSEVYDIYIERLRNYITDSYKEISIVVQEIEENKKETIEKHKQDYRKDIESLFQ